MELPVAAAGEVTKCGIVHFEREFGYLVHFNRNVVKLNQMREKLEGAETDVQTLVSTARDNGDVIREAVLGWQERAVRAQEEAKQLIDQAAHINSWFKGWCCSRFSIGRKAEKKNADIQALLDEKNAIGSTVADSKPSQSLPLVSRENFYAFPSRENTREEVIQALNNEKIHLVGVSGMPGVGKTMLIKTLAKEVKQNRLFDDVVVVTVSQLLDLEKVRGDIASSLGLKLNPQETSSIRASRLSERLSQGKKALIVLDDLWERLELDEIGIPFQNTDNCCKVVFTTRWQTVCSNMETDLDIKVELLSEEESWTLFCDKAVVVGSDISTSIAKEIVNECERLPLAIVTLGLAMRKNKNEAIWEDTLVQLKKSKSPNMKNVISLIIKSFDFLPHEVTKMCFLLCCLFPEDYQIRTDVLLLYMWGENLLKDVDTVREARGRLLSLLHELTSSNLLLEFYDKNWRFDIHERVNSFCMMHDVVRDAAIQIASNDDKLGFKVKAGTGPMNWPEVDWTYCKRMSIMDKGMSNLPSQIKASRLLTLSLSDNSHLEEIPSDFFSKMGGLRTLDLSRTGIKLVPASVSCLVNLRTLLVEECKLNSISPIQELERLEMLSLRSSTIGEWPKGVCKLRKLKLLDLSGSEWDEIIPVKVIGSMHQLEELMMSSEFFEIKDNSLYELESLTHMTSLELAIKYTGRDILFPNLEKLSRFQLFVAKDDFSTDACEDFLKFNRKAPTFQRSMYLDIPLGSVPNWVLVLMANTEQLVLLGGKGIGNVEELNGKGFSGLKALHIRRCKGMKCLMGVNVAEMTPKCAFSSLETLRISSLSSFEAFYRGAIPRGFFNKLKVLEVSNCKRLISLVPVNLLVRLQNLECLRVRECCFLKDVIQFEEGEENQISRNKSSSNFSNFPSSPIFPNLKDLELRCCDELKYVFPLSVSQDLLQLTTLRIERCTKLKIIFGSDSSEASTSGVKNKLILPKLKCLSLIDLPQLSTLTLPSLMVVCPSLEKFGVIQCMHLKKLPFDTASMPKLKLLRATQDWFSSLEWDDEDTKSLLLKTLELNEEDEPWESDDEYALELQLFNSLCNSLEGKYDGDSSDEEDDDDSSEEDGDDDS